MRTNYRSQAGFHVMSLLVVVGILAAVALVGYSVYRKNNSDSSSVSTSAANQVAAPVITSAPDLDTANTAVDKLDNSTADLDKLEKELGAL